VCCSLFGAKIAGIIRSRSEHTNSLRSILECKNFCSIYDPTRSFIHHLPALVKVSFAAVSAGDLVQTWRSMTYIFFSCQLILAGVMWLAATGKMLHPDQFLAALRLSRLPEFFVKPIAVLVPIGELGLSLGLVLSPLSLLPLVLMAVIGLLFLFTLWMLYVLHHKWRITCGCFGTASSAVDPRSLIRNIGLLLLALTGWVLSQTESGLTPLFPPSLWKSFTMVSLGCSLTLLQAFLVARPALALSGAEVQPVEGKETSFSKTP
jgi:hypothetical protein